MAADRCLKCNKRMKFVDTSDLGNCDVYYEWLCIKCEPKWKWVKIKGYFNRRRLKW